MSVILEKAPPDVRAVADKILREHRADLRVSESEWITLCIFMASRPDEKRDEPAVKNKNGWPAWAKVKPIPYDQRVDDRADAEVTIDARKWETLSERQREALLAHEIFHLEIRRDENGFVVTDDCGRPKLHMRDHDYELTGFRAIARLYGGDAIEVMQARQFEKEFGEDVLQRESLFTS